MNIYTVTLVAAATLLVCLGCATPKQPQTNQYKYSDFYSEIKKVVQSDGAYFINDTSEREDNK